MSSPEYMREWYARNPEKVREYTRQKRERRLKAKGIVDEERFCACGCGAPLAGYRSDATYHRNCFKRNATDRLSRRKYGLTRGEVNAKAEAQGGCAACGAQTPGDGRWHVDHDHRCCPGKFTCGKCVRGILCRGCNLALGSVGDDPAVLDSLAAYLRAAS